MPYLSKSNDAGSVPGATAIHQGSDSLIRGTCRHHQTRAWRQGRPCTRRNPEAQPTVLNLGNRRGLPRHQSRHGACCLARHESRRTHHANGQRPCCKVGADTKTYRAIHPCPNQFIRETAINQIEQQCFNDLEKSSGLLPRSGCGFGCVFHNHD